MKIILHQPAPETTFDAPEGNYAAELTNVGVFDQDNADGISQAIRFTFKADVPRMPNTNVMVARNFDPNSPKLNRFLERWLGREFLKQEGGKVFDLRKLVGTRAEITVHHIQNAGYSKAFRHLVGAYPPGTLDLTEVENDQQEAA